MPRFVMLLGFIALSARLEAGLIGISSNGDVSSINTSTAATTFIGNAGVSGTLSLAMNPGAVLYTVDDTTPPLFRLDTINAITGLATVGPTITGLGATMTNGLNGLAFSGSTLYASLLAPGSTSSSLYTINSSTGAAALVGVIASGIVTDLAFDPASGVLFARVRTVPVPNWVKVAVDAWTGAASLAGGHLFRPVNRADRLGGERLGEKVVWQMLQQYSATIGIPGIAPHDARRTCAKLCRAAGGELEQIQMLLGHASIQTTERYLGTKQDLVHAPNDAIRLKVAV